MMDDRAEKVVIGGEEYDLLLTTLATKEIAQKYGGLDKLGDMMQGGDIIQSLDEVAWLIATLANQPILISNRKNHEKRELLTAEDVELMTSPADIGNMSDAIMEAIGKGMKRNVVSEEIGKNAVGE